VVEGVAEVGRERVLGGDGVLAGADLDRAVAAGGADEFLDGPAGAVLDEPGDSQGREDDREAGLDRVALAVVDGGRARRSDFDMRKLFSTFQRLSRTARPPRVIR
jgi:hypothetical protein